MEAPPPQLVFYTETLKALREDLHASRKIHREMLEVLRDLRDELAIMRADRAKAERRRTERRKTTRENGDHDRRKTARRVG